MTYVLFAIFAALLVALTSFVVWLIGQLVGVLVGVVGRRSAKRHARVSIAKRFTYVATSAFLVYAAYDAIYPSDDFFLSEYKEVTLRQAPSTAHSRQKRVIPRLSRGLLFLLAH